MQQISGIHKKILQYGLCITLFVFFILISCKKDKQPNYPAGSNENINSWILDSLKRYYYWNESLPAKPSLSAKPQDFFNAVRNPADRFSYILIPNDQTTYAGSNKNFGFDYSTVLEQSTGQVIGIVKLILDDSPASRAGLKRGDYIRSINGKQLSSTNAASLQDEIFKADHFTLGLAELNGNTWKDIQTVEINKGAILDQHSINKVIDKGNKKIGYLCLHDFNPGLASSLNSAFSTFRQSGVSELILDLRYNSGGQVAEAAGLCVLIAGLPYDKNFITYKGNKNGGTRTESVGHAATFDGTVNFDALLQNSLSLKKVYILGTKSTASAAEVMINNLKPYIQVTLVGETTRGKDEASFRIFDDRKPKLVEWEMHPIIYKLFNAAGNGGYSSGINPDIDVNELGTLPLLPFGDADDPLIKAALFSITGLAKAVSNNLYVAKTNTLKVNTVLADTRNLAANNSAVITHR